MQGVPEMGKGICVFPNSAICLPLHVEIKSFHLPGESNTWFLSPASVAEPVSGQESRIKWGAPLFDLIWKYPPKLHSKNPLKAEIHAAAALG